MTTTTRIIVSIGIPLTLLFILFTGIKPAPSYTAQNLEVLESAQPNDLLLCVVPGDGPLHSMAMYAIIVEQNDGYTIFGHQIGQRLLEYVRNGRSYGFFSDCEVRLERDMPTSDMPAHIGRIILYGGLNPKPQAN